MRRALTHLALTLAVVAGCTCREPIEVAVVSPEGAQDDLPTFVRFQLTKPLYDSARPLPKLSPPKATVLPAVPFRVSLSSPYTVDVDFAQPLGPAQDYEVTLRAGLTSADGKGELKQDRVVRFRTPLNGVHEVAVYDEAGKETDAAFVGANGKLSDAIGNLGPREGLLVAFRFPLPAEQLSLVKVFVKDGAAVGATVQRDEASKERVRLVPKAPWPRDATLVLTIAAGLKVEVKNGGALGTQAPLAYELHTFGALTATGPAPAGGCLSAKTVPVTFSNPVACAATLEHLSVDVEGTSFKCVSDQTARAQRYELSPPPPADRPLHVTVSTGLKDAYGETSQAAQTFEFTACQPSVQFAFTKPFVILDPGQGTEAVERLHGAKSLQVEGKRLPLGDVWSVIQGQGLTDQVAWTELPWWLQYGGGWEGEGEDGGGGAKRPGELDGKTIPQLEGAAKVTVPVPSGDEWNDVTIGLEQFLGGKKGLVLLRETPLGDNGQPAARPVLRIANVTDIGLTARVSRNTLVVLAARYSDGKALSGVKVAIRTDDGRALGEGVTGEDGLLRMPVTSLSGAAGLQDMQLLMVATRDDDEAFLWSRFVVENSYGSGGPDLVGLVYPDRGIYRPGEKGHVRAVLRFASEKGFDSVAGQVAKLRITDADDTEVVSADLTVSEFGSIEHALDIPANAKVGTWRIQVSVGDATLNETFQVGEFRRAEMKVEIQAPPTLSWGENLRAVVQGDYLFGAPAAGLAVRWSLSRSATAFHSARLPDATFTDPTREEWSYSESQTLLSEGTAKLDENGSFVVFQPMKLPNPVGQHETVTISASVDDASGQSVSRLASVDLFAGKVLVGLTGGSYLSKVKEPVTITAVTVTPDDQLAPGTDVRIATHEITWRSVRRAGPGGGYYWTSERLEKNDVERCHGKSDAAGRFDCTFNPDYGGSLQIVAEAKDAAGRKVKAATWHWIYGDPDYWGQSSDHPQVGVLFEKDTVDAGETVKVALTSPFREGVALVTVEREDILWQKSFAMGTSANLEIPTDIAWAPNVHIVATVVRGRLAPGATPDPEKDKPQYASGRKVLNVRPRGQRLDVKVSVANARLEPGQEQKASVAVTTVDGKPAADTEVNLWAVDEGVLMLTGYKTPNLLSAMFRYRGERTLGLDTRAYVLGKRVFVEPVVKGEENGGGGGDEADAKLRKNFDPVAVWVGSAVTNAQGLVEKAFNVPDNLTTYRVMAVVSAKDDHFGQGDTQFKVNKPLMLRQALSRFARPGDVLRAGVLVNQLTDGPGKVTVTLESLDEKVFSVTGPRSFEVDVKPGQTTPVLFELTAADVEGSSNFVFAAKLGTHQDRVQLQLPVKRQTPREAVAASGVVASGTFTTTLNLPEFARAESFQVNVSGFPISAMESRLRAMVGYPYGCLEQKTSKVLPLLAIRRLADELKMTSIPADQIKGWVEEYVSIFPKYRCADDGFDYWPGCKFGSSTILSSFALEGLLTAKKFGFAVPQQEIDRTVAFLRKMVRSGSKGKDQYDGDGLVDHEFVGALRVLAAAGQPELDLEKARFDARAGLPLFAKTDLARAIASHTPKNPASEPSVKTLLDEIGKAGKEKDGSLTFDAEDPKRYWSAWESGQRNTALVLRTLVEVQPSDGRIPLLIKGLIDLDRASEYYVTSDVTQTLLGLADAVGLMKTSGAKAGVSVAGQKLGDEALGAVVKTWTVPGDKLGREIPLEIANTGTGPLFFGAYLNYAYPATARLPARANGFTLVREYLGQDGTPLPLTATDAGPVLKLKVGDFVKVRIKALVGDEGRLVVIEDPLPAGLEAVDTTLATADVAAVRKLNGEARPSWWDEYHRELRDDRVEWHYQHIWRDNLELSYVARATTAGTYYAPGAHAERMYQPHINGRSEGLVVQVAAKAK